MSNKQSIFQSHKYMRQFLSKVFLKHGLLGFAWGNIIPRLGVCETAHDVSRLLMPTSVVGGNINSKVCGEVSKIIFQAVNSLGYLMYAVQNCIGALTFLKKVDSRPNGNEKFELLRILQDYLVIRVAGLFDRDRRASSFEFIFGGEPLYENIKQQDIVLYIKELRNKFVAHKEFVKIQNRKYPSVAVILKSNLGQLLDKLSILALDMQKEINH